MLDVHKCRVITKRTAGDDHVIGIKRAIGFATRIEVQHHDRHIKAGDEALANLVERGHRDQRAGAVTVDCTGFRAGIVIIDSQHQAVINSPLYIQADRVIGVFPPIFARAHRKVCVVNNFAVDRWGVMNAGIIPFARL